MNNQDYHARHGQTFLTLQESVLTNFQLIRKDIVDPPRIQFKNLVFPALTTVGKDLLAAAPTALYGVFAELSQQNTSEKPKLSVFVQ